MRVSWSDYVKRVGGRMTHAQMAEQSGVAVSNIGRWIRGEPGLPRAESVIAFARAFGQSPLEALIAAGYLSMDEAGATPRLRTPLRDFSYGELVGELQRRDPGD